MVFILDIEEKGVALVFSLLGIAVVVSVIAVLVTTRNISWPMQRLMTAIDGLRQGDLSRRIEVTADYEVGHLALAFNRMAEDLQRNTVSRTYVEGIFRVMSESLIVVSPDGVIETVNPAACSLLGYKEAELVGTRFENVCRAWSEVADRVHRGGAQEYEVIYLTRDGRDVSVLCTANAMHAAAGNSDALDAIVIVVIDITERKRAEQELRESQMRLRELAHHLNATIEADRTRIAREIHDQLGQALTGLKLDALSLHRALRDRFEDMEPSLLDAIENMIQMINATIQTARRVATELRPAALDDLGLGPALDTFGEQFQERSGIQCETSFPELIPLTRPQATALYRIAQEGLTNVARHSGAKKVWLRLRAEQNAAVLDISDNGRGISLEQISARQSLGLLGMQERARELGGTVMIDGKPGEGTLWCRSGSLWPWSKLCGVLQARTTPDLRSKCKGWTLMVLRILVADDHPVVRRGIKNLLEQAFEASIGEASTIKEAIEAVRRAPWDIVLLDLSMPGATGLEGLIRMTRTCPNVPVLVLSMHPEEHFAVRALRSGAAGYLTKDYSEKVLLKAVKQVLAGRRYVSSTLAERLVLDLVGDTDRPPHDTLSKQEYRVMCLIASGKTVSQIAEELCLSVKTISTYRARILDKMQMQNNAELTRYCIANGLV